MRTAKYRRTTGRTTPYIGVTGFVKEGQAQEVFSVLPRNSPYFSMVGILMNTKTLHGLADKHPNRCPKREDVWDILADDSDCMNTIHYHAEDSTKLDMEMAALVGMFGDNSDRPKKMGAIQINNAWPDPKTLEWCQDMLFKPHYLQVILQVGPAAIELEDRNPKALAAHVNEYRDLVDHILIDMSGGRGALIDPQFAEKCLQAIYELEHPFNVGIAGGLCAETIVRVAPLFEKFEFLSIDAEGMLRDDKDTLSIGRAQEYLRTIVGTCKLAVSKEM